MKTLTLLLSLLSASAAMAADPAELVKLRTIYDNSLRSEFQKVGRLYHDQLVELKKNYMQAENLEAAVAVDKEIKKLRETHGKMVVKAPEPQGQASPLDGVWVRYAKGKRHLFVLQGGKFCGPDGEVGSYKLQNGMIEIGMSSWLHRLNVNHEKPDLLEGKNKTEIKSDMNASSGDPLLIKPRSSVS